MFDLFKKLFFKEQQVNIINIGDLISIPGRAYFKGDNDKLKQIDIYKEIYFNLLTGKNLLSSKELSFDNLEKEMLMNVDLVLNLIMNIDDNQSFDEQISEESLLEEDTMTYISNIELTKYKIYIKKLMLYLEDMLNIEIKSIEMLIALKELQNNRKIKKTNQFVLNQKINQLTLIIITILKQKNAINQEIKKQNINIEKYYRVNETFNQKLLVYLYKKIFDISLIYIPRDRQESITSSKLDLYTKIALLEKELEIFCYMHKEEVITIKYELANLSQISKDETNKQTILSKLRIIGDKLTIFDTYGRNIVTEDIWYEFYKVKFDTLTCNLLSLKKVPFNTAFNHQEKEYKNEYDFYKKIIMNKINSVVMGKNHNIEKIFKQDTKEAIRLIKIVLRDDENKFNPLDILFDRYKLAILLSLDTEDGLRCFYEKYTIKTLLNKSVLSPAIDFCDEVPLKTIYKMRIAHDYYQYFPRMHDDELFYLYKLLEKHTPVDDEYYFPEGITTIGTAINTDYFRKTFAYNVINYEATNRIVIMPSTLKVIRSNIFLDTKIKGIVLNDGLKELWNGAINLPGIRTITLPASLNYTTNLYIHQSLEAISFKDYKHSGILHNYEELFKLINDIYHVHFFGSERGIVVGPDKVELGNDDKINVYRECAKVQIYTTIKHLFFEEDGKTIGCIYDLPLLFKTRYGKSKTSSYLHEDEIAEIISILKEKLKETTGYDLVFNDSKAKKKKRSYGFHNYF